MRLANPLPYADARPATPLKNASNSALIWSFSVEHIPCGAPGMTVKIAPFTSLAESSAEDAEPGNGRRRDRVNRRVVEHHMAVSGAALIHPEVR